MKVASLEFDLLANVARLQQDMTKAQQVMGRSLNAMEQSIQRTMNTFNRLGTAFGLLLGGSVAGKIIEMADDWGQYASRMKMATQSADEYGRAQARMMRSAQATFRPINETREAFINLSPVLRDMGMSFDQSINAVDAFSGLLVTAGANAQRGETAMNALSKSLQKGKVDANSWATIYTTADGILEHLVETTGKSADELRRLGAEGNLSATELANALTSAYGPVMEQVENMPTTVSDAVTNMRTAIGEYIGTMNGGLSVTAKIADGITLLADNFDLLVVGVGVLSSAAIPALIGKITALTVAIATNPIGLLAVAIAASIAYLISLRDEVNKFGKEMDALGAVWDMVKDGFISIWETGKSVFDNILKKVSGSTEGMELSFDSAFMAITGALDTFHGAIFGSFSALEALWNTASHNLIESFAFAFNKVREKASDMMIKVAALLNQTPFFNIEVTAYSAPSSKPDYLPIGDAMTKAFNEHKGGLGLQSIYREASDARKIEREINELEGWYTDLYGAVDEGSVILKNNSSELDKNSKKLSEAAKAAKKFAQEREDAFKKQYEGISALQEERRKLEDQIKTFGMSKRAIEQLDIARLKEQKTLLSGFAGSERAIELLQLEIEEREKLLNAGFTLDALEKGKRANQELADEVKRTHDEIERSLTDSIMRSFENGMPFAKNFFDSIKNLASTLILRPIVQPISEGIAGAVTGALGMGKGSGFGLFDGLGMASNLKSLAGVFSGSLVSSMGSGIASLGTTFGSSAMGSFAAGMKGSTLAAGLAGPTTAGAGGAMGAGAAFGAALPWVAGGLAVASLIPTIHNMFKGEKRGGGYYQYDLDAGQAVRKGGASAGDGGKPTWDALTQMFGSTTSLIEDVFKATGVDASVAFYEGMFEDSKKGRGGVFSGGLLDVGGQQVRFGTNKKGAGYGDTSGNLEEMFENLQKDLAFSTLEAWQAVSHQMPDVINRSLDGVDIRALSPEQAAAAVEQISGIVSSVTALTTALDALPFDNLAGLSFDLTASLLEAAGGMEHLIGGIENYYQGFYSEVEQQARAAEMLAASVQELGYELPSTRDGFRGLVESLDATDASSHAAIAGLFSLSGAADQFYAAAEQAALKLADERSKIFEDQLRLEQDAHAEQQRLQQEAYSAARSHVDQLMSAFKTLAQTQIKELEKAATVTDKIANALQKTLNTQISSLQSVTALLDDMVRELRGGAGLFEMQAAEGWRLIGNTLTTGIIPNADELRGAVNAIKGGFGDKAYDSIFERDRDQLVLANQLEQINAMAEPQLTIAEQQLKVMQDQLDQLRGNSSALDGVDLNTETVAELTKRLQTAMEAESIANKQIKTIQDQLDTMQKQYDQLRGLNATMTTLDEGMRLLAKAMKAEEASKPQTGTGGTGSAPSQFGDKDYQLKNQTEARNYVLSNTGLLSAFATEVANGWVAPSDYLKFAQFHYGKYGWDEDRRAGAVENLGRTHQPGSYSEAQAYLANNTDILSAYLSDVRTDASLMGDKGLLRFAQAHYRQYGVNEMPLRKYASGGDHPGGLRLVGELGPELEATGPSRIMSASRTQSILSKAMQGPDMSGLINTLIRENQELRRMYERSMKAMVMMQQRMARVLERWEGDDYPVRVEEMPDEPIKTKEVA